MATSLRQYPLVYLVLLAVAIALGEDVCENVSCRRPKDDDDDDPLQVERYTLLQTRRNHELVPAHEAYEVNDSALIDASAATRYWTSDRTSTNAATNAYIEEVASSKSPLPSSSTAVIEVRGVEDLLAIDHAIATRCLTLPFGSAVVDAASVHRGPRMVDVVSFSTPAWPILHGPEVGTPPYKDVFTQLNATHGSYSGFAHSIVISRCSGSVLEETPFGQSVDELRAFQRLTCSEAEASANAAARHLVVRLNYPEGGFFGHAIDNLMPRLAALLPAARLSGHRVSVVFPRKALSFYSKNTGRLLASLGVKVLRKAPPQPYRAAGISGVGTWDRLLRLSFRSQVRAGMLLRRHAPAECTEVATTSRGGLYLSRSRGAANGREVSGSGLLEEAMERRGFEVLTDIASVPLAQLASRLYSRTCSLAGFSGTQLLNLVFLPDGARVIEFHSHNVYEDYWQWAHALGLHYRHVHTHTAIEDSTHAEALAKEATAL